MAIQVCPPGATTVLLAANVYGTTTPTTSGAQWEVFDRSTAVNAVIATDITPNGWGEVVSGGADSNTVPAGAGQGNDPDGNGRYEVRFSAGYVSVH